MMASLSQGNSAATVPYADVPSPAGDANSIGQLNFLKLYYVLKWNS